MLFNKTHQWSEKSFGKGHGYYTLIKYYITE